MDLKTYAVANEGTAKRECPILARVAAAAECSAETIYMITMGHKRPSALLSRAIEQATNGGVTRYDLRPDVFGAAPAQTTAA